MIFKSINTITLFVLIIFFKNFAYAQSISIYPKSGKKIKIYDTYDIENGSIIVKDSILIKNIIPLISIKKIKYAQKSYKFIGSILLFSGKLILNCSLLPAIAGHPTIFYSYGAISSAVILSGVLLTEIGSRIGRNTITYKLKGLNYYNRELIFSSIFADMNLFKQQSNNSVSEFQYKPLGKKIILPNRDWFFDFSAKSEPVGIEAWIIKNRLREKKFLQFAIPSK